MDQPLSVDKATMLEIARLAVQLYAETHPRPPHVNQQQAAEMLCISHVTVAKLVRAGEIRMNAVGKIPTSEIDRCLAVPDCIVSKKRREQQNAVQCPCCGSVVPAEKINREVLKSNEP